MIYKNLEPPTYNKKKTRKDLGQAGFKIIYNIGQPILFFHHVDKQLPVGYALPFKSN